MILALIRERTGPLHERLERAVDLPKRLDSPENYAALLAKFYGFYRPLEERLAAVSGYESVGLDLGARLKTPLLRADLRVLGYTPDALAAVPLCVDLPEVTGLDRALGCLYVLEGATLGGQIVRKQVWNAFRLGPEAGCSFFSSYREHVGAMWAAFREGLAEYGRNNAEAEGRVVAAAVDTFSRFGEWMAW